MGKRTNNSWAQDIRARDARSMAVWYLRMAGYSFKEVAVALKLTPERTRQIYFKVAR